MIRHLKHQEIDRQRWDSCILESRLPLIYAFSWYMDIVCPGWEGLVAGDYEAVFPVTRGRKYGLDYIYQPFFTQQLGLFSKTADQNPRDFLSQLPPSIMYIQLCLNESNCEDLHNKNVKPSVTYHLRLDKDYEEIESGFTVTHRRNLLKADKGNQVVKTNSEPVHLINMFRDNQGKRVKKLGDEDYSRLQELMEVCLERRLGERWEVLSPSGKSLGGAFLISSPGRIIYHFAASTPEGRNSGAMYQLISEILRSKAGSDQIFDFEGSNFEGLARFFKGFGPYPATYPCILINRLPRPLRWFKRSGW